MKEMKKIIALGAALLVLVIALMTIVIVKHEEKKRKDKEIESQQLVLCERESLRSLTVEESNGAKTVIYMDDNSSAMKIIRDDKEFSKIMLDTAMVNNWIDSVLRFSVENSFDSSDDLSAYGLSSPQYRISAEKKDGTNTVFSVGNLVSNQSGVYLQLAGENKVYVASYIMYKTLSSPFENLLNHMVLYLERSEVDQISLERKSTKDHWTVKTLPDEDNGLFIEPRYKVLYPMQRDPKDMMYNLLSSILQFEVSQYIPIAEEDMASYGLADPEYKITIRPVNGEEITIVLSQEIGGYYYGSCSSNPYTFRIDPESLPGLNLSSFELIDSYVIHGYLDEIASVQATIKDTKFVLECHMNQANEFLSDESTIQLDQRNAKVFASSGDCYGLLLFGSIFNMPVSRVDYDIKPELKNVEASFHVIKTSGEIVDLQLVPNGSDEYYCFINNSYSGFIVDRSVLYKDNGHELSGFGVWDAFCLTTEAIDKKDSYDMYDRP